MEAVVGQKAETKYFVAYLNTIYEKEMERLLTACGRLNIDVILLKGIALLQSIYRDDISQRPMCDADILIHRDDLGAINQILTKAGYVVQDGLSECFRDEVRWAKGMSYAKKLNNGLTIIIEVSWELLLNTAYRRSINLDMKDVWGSRREIFIGSTRGYQLKKEVALIYYALHLVFPHTFHGDKWYHDIVRLSRDDMDWAEVLALAAKWRVKKPLYYVLRLSNELFGNCLSPDILEPIEPANPENLFRHCRDLAQNRSFKSEYLYLEPLLLDTNRDRLIFLREYFFPPLSYLAWRYHLPKWAAWIKYFHRLFMVPLKALIALGRSKMRERAVFFGLTKG